MAISLKSISPPLIVTYILGALLLIFTVAKASMTSLTYDEAFTFIYYLPQDFMRIFSFAAPYSANNHILSSLLMKVSQNLFGSSELALRIPSLLAHVVYICLTIAFLRKLSPLLLIPGFLLLNTNPYLLEFFALGRGYGLAICLMMGSLLMWIKYRETQKVRAYTLCLILAGAAAFSNFSLLLVVASILLLHNYEGLLSGKISTRSPIALLSSGLKHNKINLIFLVILVMVFYEPIRRCIKFKLLYHGGVTGFWPESIMTLLQFSLYDASYTTWLLNPLSWFLMAVLIISMGLLVNSIRVKVKENDSTPNWKMDFGLLFVLIILICTVANWSFGNKYVIDRGALFLYPLIVLILLTMLDELFGFRGFKKIGFVLIIVFGLG
ncbi:MAG: glycosyltransferase family 39 protein, partial [Flavobacteriales bacterium]|nr:glycosyltransferase family 39 protein [Flavobacteriales bacterium]